MMFEKFKNNGTAFVRFTEDMIDQDSGFNISMLNMSEGLMVLNISLC